MWNENASSRGAGMLLALTACACGGRAELELPAAESERRTAGLLALDANDEWNALSADGTTVVGNRYEDEARSPRVWTRSNGSSALKPAPSGDSTVIDVNADGSLFAGTTAANGSWQPYLSRTHGVEYLPFGGSVAAISESGEWMVGANLFKPDYIHAYRWSASTGFVDLGALQAEAQSLAAQVSENGRVVIGRSGEQAYRWTEETGMVALPLPDGRTRSHAVDLSADGSVIFGATGSFDEERWYATLWRNGRLEELEPGTSEITPMALNGDGSVAVGGGDSAVIWSEKSGLRRISDVLVAAGVDLDGWQLAIAIDVSADGKVVLGSGTKPGEKSKWWIAWLP